MTLPKKNFGLPPNFSDRNFFKKINRATSSNLYWFYYPHRSRELVSPVCRIFFYNMKCLLQEDPAWWSSILLHYLSLLLWLGWVGWPSVTPNVGWPLGLWPSAKPNPTVCSLACRWRLKSTLRADHESFSIESGLMVMPYADSSELYYSNVVINISSWQFFLM